MSAPLWQEPNLARAPFVNERPVRRLATVLWVLFVLVSATAFWISRTIHLETGARVADLARLSAETVTARARAVALDAELRRADLPAQNVRADFLNRRIAERAFSWNRLLETLTHEMPRGVRLLRLAPEGFTRERGRERADAQTVATTRVALRITGEAEDTESLLEFVDRLFRHPAFAKPNLARESGKKDFKIQFDLAVDYLPQLAGDGAEGASTAAATSGGVGGGSSRPGGPSGPSAAAGGTGITATAGAGRPPAEVAAGASSAAAKTPAQAGAGVGRLGPGAGLTAKERSEAAPADVDPDEASAQAKKEPDRRGGPAVANPGAGSGAGESGGAAYYPGAGAPTGGAIRPGAGAPPAAAPAPGNGAKFPYNVLPTPLRPYASSAGGRS